MTKPTDNLTTAPDLRANTPRSDAPPVGIASDARALLFDGGAAHCLYHGISNIALTATRIGADADGKLAMDEVTVAFLRGSIPALRQLRYSIDKLLKVAEPSLSGEVIN